MTAFRIEDLLLGDSAAIQGVRALVLRLAPTRLPVLVQGPTGVGKELVADALHRLSGRRGSLVAVNVCAIAESMFEDALFGHVRGAFSGSVGDAPGFLAEANGGSLFLDEIGGLAYVAQAKLLRALELGRYRAVGAQSDAFSDFRVIAAANESLDALVEAGRFRFDLLQRVRAAVVRVPALEERVEDIHILAAVFAKRAQAHARPPTITEGAIRYLERRSWPGNVRELKHLVECATALSNDGIITRDDLASVSPSADLAISRVALEVTARRRLVAILEENEWDLLRTAARLAVHRVTLWRRMCRLGIVRSRYAPDATRSRASGDEDVAPCCTPLRNTPAP